MPLELALMGPLPFDRTALGIEVPASGGIFLLCDAENNAIGLGRCQDLRRELLAAAQDPRYQDARFFYFQPARESKHCFDLHCLAFHKFRPRLDAEHPPRPDGVRWQCAHRTCAAFV